MVLLRSRLRVFFAMLLLVAGVGAAAAQQIAAPWQETVSGQIEAFRMQDPNDAFFYAGAPFHQSFPSAEAFFLAIVGSGYAPIMESRSHSFGSFEVLADKSVLQEVKLVGNDQSLYGAIYQLAEEPEGWRVMGVQLVKQPGMGI